MTAAATVAAIEASVGASSRYTAATWAPYAAALAAAKAIAAKPTATKAEIDKALNTLYRAMSALVPAAYGVTTSSIKVKGKAFAKGTKPKVTVTVKLTSGTPQGKVVLYVGKKKVKKVAVSKVKTTITLKKAYRKAIKVKATYQPSTLHNGTTKTSSVTKVKVKK